MLLRPQSWIRDGLPSDFVPVGTKELIKGRDHHAQEAETLGQGTPPKRPWPIGGAAVHDLIAENRDPVEGENKEKPAGPSAELFERVGGILVELPL